MKKSSSNVLEFTTKFINSNFRIKVFGRTEDGKKINTLVGVSGILKLIGAELFNKFIKRGEYKETELDKRKREVDFLILGVGNRWEIRFNHQVSLKENRSIKKGECSDNVYFVTSNALEKLKKQYSYECDF